MVESAPGAVPNCSLAHFQAARRTPRAAQLHEMLVYITQREVGRAVRDCGPQTPNSTIWPVMLTSAARGAAEAFTYGDPGRLAGGKAAPGGAVVFRWA